MWLVIEEVEFESYYSALDNPHGLYSSKEKAQAEVQRLRDEYEHLYYRAVFVEVRG